MNATKIMKKLADAASGIAVAVAFFNTALLVVELVKAVTEYDGGSLDMESEESGGLEWTTAAEEE